MTPSRSFFGGAHAPAFQHSPDHPMCTASNHQLRNIASAHLHHCYIHEDIKHVAKHTCHPSMVQRPRAYANLVLDRHELLKVSPSLPTSCEMFSVSRVHAGPFSRPVLMQREKRGMAERKVEHQASASCAPVSHSRGGGVKEGSCRCNLTRHDNFRCCSRHTICCEASI